MKILKEIIKQELMTFPSLWKKNVRKKKTTEKAPLLTEKKNVDPCLVVMTKENNNLQHWFQPPHVPILSFQPRLSRNPPLESSPRNFPWNPLPESSPGILTWNISLESSLVY